MNSFIVNRGNMIFAENVGFSCGVSKETERMYMTLEHELYTKFLEEKNNLYLDLEGLTGEQQIQEIKEISNSATLLIQISENKFTAFFITLFFEDYKKLLEKNMIKNYSKSFSFDPSLFKNNLGTR